MEKYKKDEVRRGRDGTGAGKRRVGMEKKDEVKEDEWKEGKERENVEVWKWKIYLRK